jgi:hypothetical protein
MRRAVWILGLAALAVAGCSSGDVSAEAAQKAYDEQAKKAEALEKSGTPRFDSSN